MNTHHVASEIEDAHAELAVLVNTLINTPVTEQSAQLVDGLSFDLKDDIGRRFNGLKNDLKAVREAAEELEDEIKTVQRSLSRLDAASTRQQTEQETRHQQLLGGFPGFVAAGAERVVECFESVSGGHQAEQEKRHQHLLGELPVAIALGADRVVEVLGKGNRLQHQQTSATLKGLGTRLDELHSEQTQAVERVQQAVDALAAQMSGLHEAQAIEARKSALRFGWTLAGVGAGVLLAAAILLRLFLNHAPL